MPIASTLAGLAMNPLLDSTPLPVSNDDAKNLAASMQEELQKRFAEVEVPLLDALRSMGKFTWQMMEFVFAQDSFWERCIPLVDQDDHKKFRSAAKALAEFCGILRKHDFDTRACIREIGSARSAGLLELKDVSIQQLAEKTIAVRQLGQVVPVEELRWLNVGSLAKEFSQAGYREMGFALNYHPREIEAPLIGLIAEYYFRQSVAADPNLTAGLSASALDQKTSQLDQHFTVIDRFLRKEFDRVEGMLVSLQQGAAGSTAPALDLRVEQHRIGKPYIDLYNDFAALTEKMTLSTGAIRRPESKLFNKQTDGQLIQELFSCYKEIPKDERDNRVALRNVVGRFRYITGDFASAKTDFTANIEQLSDPVSKGETFFNAYQCALMLNDWSTALNYLQAAIKCAPRLFIPFPLGKYQLVSILGISPAGVVFSCESQSPKAKVIIKTLGDADQPERVLEDIKSLAGKDLPGIGKILDCSYVDPTRRVGPYVVVEEMNGKTLDAHIREHGRLSPLDVASIGHQLSETLHGLHRQNLLHRNLSPETVYLRQIKDPKTGAMSWEVRVTDVAFAPKKWAKPPAGSTRRLTDPIEFAPPEQRGETKSTDLTPASDIHALGRVCCYALFQNPDPSDAEIDSVSRPLADLLLDCLEDEPHRRPPDCLSLFRRWEKAKSAEESAAADREKVSVEEPVRVAAPRREDSDEDDRPARREENVSRSERDLKPLPANRSARGDDEDSPRPRRALNAAKSDRLQRGRDEDDDELEDRTERSSKMGVVIGGLVALLMCVGGLLYFFVFKKSPNKPAKDSVDVVQNDNSTPPANTSIDPFEPKPELQDSDPPPVIKKTKDPNNTVKPKLPEDAPKKTPANPPMQGSDLSKIAWSKVYLSDMDEVDSRSGPWPVTKNGQLGNLAPPFGPDPPNLTFKVRAKPSPKGISMHPPDNPGPAIKDYAFAQYQLTRVGQRFRSRVAIADTGNPLSDVFFEVQGDGKRLWAQGLRATRQVLELDVDVAGVNVLELRTYVRGIHVGAHAVWLDPYVTKQGTAPPTPEDPKLEFPPKSLDKPTPVLVENGTSYLSDRKEFGIQDGAWPFTKGGRLGNPVDPLAGFKTANELIQVNGTEVPKGLSMAPAILGPASVKYRLDRQATWFFTEIALNDKAKGVVKGAITFEVFGDDKSLWKSDPLHEAGKIAKCDLNIAGVEILELRTSVEGSALGAQAIWVNPKVTLKSESMPKKDDSVVKVDPETATGKKVFLTYLKAHEVEDGAWPITRQGRIGIGDGVKSAAAIKVGGMEAKDGISMHPGKSSEAKLSFRVKKAAKAFIAQVGMDDSAFIARAAIFEVYGDGKLLFLSDDIGKHSKPQKVALDVSNYDIVELRTKMSEHGGGDDCRAVWIDPYFIWDDTKGLPQRQTYLAELTPFDIKRGYWNITVGRLGDEKAVGDLSLDDKPSKKGICMHPALRTGASIKFPLNRKYARLVGKVGLSDSAGLTPPKGSVEFLVAVDEKIVWTSKPVNKTRTFEDFDIDLKGAGVVQLRTRAIGSITGLHAVWIDPVVSLNDDKQ